MRCKFPSEFGTLHRAHGKKHSVEVVGVVKHGFELNVFLRLRAVGAQKVLGLFADRFKVRVNYYPFEMVRYLVDPASSHMLVSKIKPCMSKYKPH